MPWLDLIAYLLGPLAKPPGEPLSSSTVNVIWTFGRSKGGCAPDRS